ncbi:MAG: hypothetical protein GOVbin2014_19 [Prokaryotic dsDNA virus sp.]|nr:MAG: hypothetical protein GOVbin2014_19 [Prokaryotic dsDNA virus sp.]|tara:strand:- start:165 stop:542 length:378 start_codon:yes stop_codon:yes gene_type:complete
MKTINKIQHEQITGAFFFNEIDRDFNYEQIAAVKNGSFVIPFERKVDFDDCRSVVSLDDLNAKQLKAINNAPSLTLKPNTSAFDYLYPTDFRNKYIYTVTRGNKTFLVNNEGFGYSRYIVELKKY